MRISGWADEGVAMKYVRYFIFFILFLLFGLYLLNRDLYQMNPYQIPATLEAVKLIQYPDDTFHTYQENNQACVDVFVSAFQVDDVYDMEFEVTINNSAVGRAYITQSIIASFDPIWIVCIDISGLPTGEHLAELQFRPNLESDRISYQWAINVEPSLTPSPTP